MMRYQSVSPDFLPLTNGAKKQKPSYEETIVAGKLFDGGSCTTTATNTTTSSSLDGGVPNGFRFRSTQQQQQQGDPNTIPNPSRPIGGDLLLQWGQRKRSRISRSEIRSSSTTTTTVAEDSSSSSGQGNITQSRKKLRRSVMNQNMPPPPPPPSVFSGRSINTRNGFGGGGKEASASFFLPSSSSSRNLEDRSANGSPSRNIINGRMVSRSVGSKRSPPSPPDQTDKRSSSLSRDQRQQQQQQQQNGSDHQHNHQRVHRSESTAQAHHHHHHQEVEISNNNNGEREKAATQVEWPRIYIALSRKEKEEDFLVMKGTKLPHRPRKRPKNIDKSLQYCFPGMWLSDLTKTRYEVREKKNVKKQQKRRGLKGMENMDSDSE